MSSLSRRAIEPSIKGLRRVCLRGFVEPFPLFGLGLSGIMKKSDKLQVRAAMHIEPGVLKEIARLEELCRELDIFFRSNSVEQKEGESDEKALARWYDERNNLIVEIGNLLTETGIVSK